MNKKNFMASNWFSTNKIGQERSESQKHEEPSSSQDISASGNASRNMAPSLFAEETAEIHTGNEPISQYFVPGWKGESLISKNVKKFIEVLDKFHKDAKTVFYGNEELSRKLKISIYNEFLSYSESKAINCTELDHYTTFWSELNRTDSKYAQEINGFVNILALRIAVVYLLKIRFILVLQKQTESKFDIKDIYYPNSYLTKIFKTASSTELKTKAFEQNIFSWYRPNEGLKNELLKFKNICPELKITDIIKTISIKSEKILDIQTDYSHAFSHKNFGLFLNSLLLNFPQWLKTLNQTSNRYVPPSSSNFFDRRLNLEIISTKFAGDNLESLALSHWLAQDSNKEMHWDQILCPSFKKQEFGAGLYLKTVHELQFLTFLAEIANIQGAEPKQFVCAIMKSNLHNRKNSSQSQKSLLLSDSEDNHSTYDRVILNLNKFPKNNPQHFLFTKIANQKQFLKENGLLYIITSKKLFVPSQKAKVEALLRDFKVEGVFDLEDVKGRGEIGSHIYIFSNKANTFVSSNEKHTCLSFRFHAQLQSFQEFSKLTDLAQDFLASNKNDIPPLYQRSEGQFRLEFYQDAIANGQLINSSSKDSSRVTHPHFFKKLMAKCNSLDYFFDIQNVNFEESDNDDTLFDFSQSFKREKSPYVLIIDQRMKDNIKLEVISSNALEAKSYEYGHALCSYFYAYQKWPNLNIFTIKSYFESSIGKQIINLTFSNEIRKVKGNLNKLLIPKYFSVKSNLPAHIAPSLRLLSQTPEQLLQIHPLEIDKQYQNIKAILPTLVKTYPAEVLDLLSQFKRSAYSAFELIGNTKRKTALNFSNPVLMTPLTQTELHPIYPDNKDLFIEFNPDAMSNIHSPMVKTKRSSELKSDYTSYRIDLFSENERVISIYSDESMISFVEFILTRLMNAPISKVLQAVQVPSLEELKVILSAYNSLNQSIIQLNTQLPGDFDQLINSTILNS